MRPRSFRARFLLIVLGVAVFPLLVLGVWLTRSVARSGESLVRSRLKVVVNESAERIAQRWMLQRSLLLDAVESPEVRTALTRLPSRAGGAAVPLEAIPALSTLRDFHAVRLRDLDDRPLLTLRGEEAEVPRTASLAVVLAVRPDPLGEPMAQVEARLPVSALLPRTSPSPGGMGALLGLYEAETLAPLLPLPFELRADRADRLEWGGERWLTITRRLREPSLLLVGAAPISLFSEPFRAAAREGTWLLAAVGLAAFLLTVVLTTGMTRSLGRLASAAETVAAGDLDLVIEEGGDDEVGRVGRAFNRMTQSLRGTLQELADHRALAAVGEFAASLAHEIRNPLSAVRLDLQVVEEELPPDSSLHRLQARALADLERMDATLGGALETARSGRWEPDTVSLVDPLEAAVESARAAAGPGGPRIEWGSSSGVEVMGEVGALRQLFLNIILNACDAAGPGGRVVVHLERREDVAVVRVVDDGPGIPEDLRPRIREPLVSGRRGGTGLGLSIADRIVRAHGGELELSGAPDGGTMAAVRLPVPSGGGDVTRMPGL